MKQKMCGFAVGVVLAWGMVGGEVFAQEIDITDNKTYNITILHIPPEYTGFPISKDVVGSEFVIVQVNTVPLTVDVDYEWWFNTKYTDVGKYSNGIVVVGKGNYMGTILGELIIIPKSVDKPTLAPPTTFNYDGIQKTVTITPENSAAYALSGHTGTNVDNYTATVKLTSKTNYRWAGTSSTDTADLTFDWSINKATVAKPSLTQTTFSYTGSPQTTTLSPPSAAYEIIAGHTETNVGNYTATVTLNNPVGKSNYEWEGGGPDPLSLSWSIMPQSVVKPTLTQTSFAYNGGEHAVALSVPAETDKYTLGGVVSAINAGSYTATVALIDPVNYQWEDGTAANVPLPWTIAADISSVLSSGREFPNAAPDNSAVVIAPVNITAFEVSAGPNPVRKSDGGINIFVSGKRVDDGTLTVYDVSGNVIRKINIRDNAALGNNGRRVVGSWDLKDGKGNNVSEGTYLLRGSVKTVDGKRERVSVIVGVR